MWRETAESLGIVPRAGNTRWTEAFAEDEHEWPIAPHPVLLIGGLVALGLGLLTWYYVGHDVKRYIRIRNM
jgi:hypothetical protein